MKTFTLITALTLCSFSWISVSGSESQTVEVQSGENVTLTCSNMSRVVSLTWWSRMVNRTKASCITFMYSANSDVKYCDGFQKLKYEMSSNISTVFLKIKGVDSFDSGLYFYGFISGGRPIFGVIRLNVEGKGSNETHDDVDSQCSQCEMSDGTAKLTSMILGGLTVFLVAVIVGLVVKVRKLQTAASEDQNSQQYENVDCDELRDAALSLYSSVGTGRPASEREVKTCVVHAASR